MLLVFQMDLLLVMLRKTSGGNLDILYNDNNHVYDWPSYDGF